MFTRPARILALLMAFATPLSAAELKFAPTPKEYPFSSAVALGDILFLSGETGFTPDGKLVPGFSGQVRQTMENIGATLKSQGLGMNDVFKCTVYLTDMSQWDAFNKIYVPYFKPGRMPARTAVGVAKLGFGAQVEIECWAKRK